MAEIYEKSGCYRCYAKIDLNAIEKNFEALKKMAGPGVKLCAVIKADGYGHGSVPIARLLEKKADYFAVAALEEAIVLREAGIQTPVLALAYTAPDCFGLLIEQNVTATIYREEDAKALSDAAAARDVRAKVHIALDTGMGRIGFFPDEKSADTVRRIAGLPGLEVEGLFSHYATADCRDKTAANLQTERFDRFIALLEERGVQIPIKHICNSAGMMEFGRHYDMVRMGIALYGLYPSEEVEKDRIALAPAMEVVCRVIHVKTVEAGTGIGYGHAYVTEERRSIATCSIGYADGYNRCLSGKGYVLIHGKKAPICGRICMDQIMVDVTDIPGVRVGDLAVVLGKSGALAITAEELGALCGSFNYEVVCTFMPRAKRLYYQNGALLPEGCGAAGPASG